MPKKSNPATKPAPVLTLRIPAESMRQLDTLAEICGMNRNQVMLMLIAKEFGKFEPMPSPTAKTPLS
jgi:hypothetical protein